MAPIPTNLRPSLILSMVKLTVLKPMAKYPVPRETDTINTRS
jgi:hypothetical protein